MALAKKSGGGVSGWVAAALLALGIFAAVGDTSDVVGSSDATPTSQVEVSLQD